MRKGRVGYGECTIVSFYKHTKAYSFREDRIYCRMIYVKVGSLNNLNFDVSDAHFQGLVNLTGLSRLKYNVTVSCRFVMIDITAAQRGPFNALALSLDAMPLARSNFLHNTELYVKLFILNTSLIIWSRLKNKYNDINSPSTLSD